MGESVPNLLDGIFRVAYTYSSTGFLPQVNTTLDGNVTIGNNTTNYSLLLNGLPITNSGGGVLPSNWAQYPAVQDVNMSGYRLYSPNNTIFFGVSAGLGSTSGTVIAIGRSAALNNIGATNVIAIGNNAAASNAAGNVVAIGNTAGTNNTAGSVVIIGLNAGTSNTGSSGVMIGVGVGGSNTGSSGVMIGVNAGTSNTGSNVVFMGNAAGGNNRGRDVISIGRSAGFNNSADTVTSIGTNAGYGNTGRLCTFIGNNPNTAITNASDDQFIVYSGTGGNPLIQGNTGTNVVTVNRLQVKTIDPSTSATGPLSQIYYSASDKQLYYY